MSLGLAQASQISAEAFLRGLNPCTKLASLLVFVISVVSVGKYELSSLIIYLSLPVFASVILEMSAWQIFLRTMPALLLAVAAGAANIFTDTGAAFEIANVSVSLGVLSFLTLILKAYLCVSLAIVLSRTSSPNDIAYALGKFKMPCIIAIQLMLTARYLETIGGEAFRICRAYALRSPKHPKIRLRHFPHIFLSLLLRSVDRANRIYKAMQCRGFDPRNYKFRNIAFKFADFAFFAAFLALCCALRFFNPAKFF